LTILPKIRLGIDKVPVTSGEYPLQISFAKVSDKEYHKPYITENITVISPTEPIIGREDIESYALKHPEVKKWVDDHTGNSISKVKNGDYYILWYDGWQKTSEEDYKTLGKGIYQQEKGIHYKGGFWLIQYVSKIGKEPHRIEIKLHAVSGEVLEVKTFER
jgi:hypothetical protein